MSLISMLTMEFVENIVDMYLTKGSNHQFNLEFPINH